MEKLLGAVWVDSGTIWLGDPCYVMGHDASYSVKSWTEFVNKLSDSDTQKPLGPGVGILASTTHGDGSYPVYGIYNQRGKLTGLRVDFDVWEYEG